MTLSPGAMAPGLPLLPERWNHECRPPPLPIPRLAISAAERARRECELGLARGNARHEGSILSDSVERLDARYLARQLGTDMLTVAIFASKVVQPRLLARTGRKDCRVKLRLPYPTNVRKTLSVTFSIVATGRGQRQGCAVPPILPQPSLGCAPLRPRQNRHPHAPLARRFAVLWPRPRPIVGAHPSQRTDGASHARALLPEFASIQAEIAAHGMPAPAPWPAGKRTRKLKPLRAE